MSPRGWRPATGSAGSPEDALAVERIVLEFARAPTPGRVKTRLARTEGPAEAARIYRRLAGDVHRTLLAFQTAGFGDVAVCAAEDPRAVGAWLSGARRLYEQGEGDLGTRMSRCFERAFSEGAGAAAAVGTDVVGLTVERLREAFRALEAVDVAMAPTPDGGYALLALKAPAPALFRDVPWSTSRVADVTRERARAAGLVLAELSPLRDVDTAADLEGVIPLLSVLVPVLNEMPHLEENLRDLTLQARPYGLAVEVVVADGGSTDGSAACAAALGGLVVRSPPGRGTQLNCAAQAAGGRWLWTLHADERLAPGTLDQAVRFARRGTRPWGFFRTRIDAGGPGLRVVETFAEHRARWLRLPYGDQGLIVRRAAYEAVGGYEDVALMEDVLLVKRLRRYGPPAMAGGTLLTHARRWEKHGVLGTTLRNWTTYVRFAVLGHDPARLARSYRRGRADTLTP